MDNYFFNQFVNNFKTLLLYKVNVLEFFILLIFFQVFVISRTTDMLFSLTVRWEFICPTP